MTGTWSPSKLFLTEYGFLESLNPHAAMELMRGEKGYWIFIEKLGKERLRDFLLTTLELLTTSFWITSS